nr:hypothetical protein [Chryseobacterium sp. ON_d1]
MKTMIFILTLLSCVVLGCRSKHKITTTYRENTKESEKMKMDSSGVKSSTSVQSKSDNTLLKEEKNEISGELFIEGKSDLSNPFVFHNVVGKDTVQSISIMGNAEYIIRNYYTKAHHQKAEVKKEESALNMQEVTHKAVSKENHKEVASKVSEETKKVQLNGLDAAAWIFILIMGITLILVYFTYTYFKK